ncbi:MAG: efflux RND transporter periplasmic adaptor subunit [Nannocystaceae bacterium]|nr:hypothetical protein [bacterium]
MDPVQEPPRSLTKRVAVFALMVGLGAAAFAWQQHTAKQGRRRPAREVGQAVRVMPLAPLEVTPTATGYGEVAAQRDWEATAEVGGVVDFLAEGLEVGHLVPEGTVLLRIDPQSFDLEHERSEASVKGVKAQLAQLVAQEKSARANLALEQSALDLAEAEVESLQDLYDAGTAPLIDLQTAQKAVIAAKKAVQGYKNTLSEIPSSRRILQAQLEQQQVGVETTKLDRAKTEIVAPFTMRLRQVDVSLDEAVSAGQVMLIGDGVDVVEIAARIPVGSLGALLPRRPRPAGPPLPDPDPATAPELDAARQQRRQTSFKERLQSIEAAVVLDTQGVSATWHGKLRRLEGVDPTTRNLVAVVQVDETRGKGGPPLAVGLYVEVELRGPARPDCLAVPPQAVHGGRVYVVGDENRLEFREVDLDLVQEEYICVGGGVSAGEDIILSDLSPAVEGMLLDPRVDDRASVALTEAVGPSK